MSNLIFERCELSGQQKATGMTGTYWIAKGEKYNLMLESGGETQDLDSYISINAAQYAARQHELTFTHPLMEKGNE
jgi:hypothetical protein